MTEGKKIPQWAIGLLISACAAVSTVAFGLGTYVFTGLVQKVEQTADSVHRINSQMAVMQIQIETQSKFCRFPIK